MGCTCEASGHPDIGINSKDHSSTHMQTLLQVAEFLAGIHRKQDPRIQEILFFDDPKGRVLRLLVVSPNVGQTGSILTCLYAARPEQGIPYPSELILASPEEKALLDRGELFMPEKWKQSQQI